MGQTPN